MKKIMLSIAALLCAVYVFAGGTVRESLTMKSAILGMERRYSVYLPEGYDSSSRLYPVLYLLHGAGGNETNWIQLGEVCRIADQEIDEGRATPMIIVMPDASSGQQGYYNDMDGKWRYEDFFFEEFIPHIEKTYRCRAERHYRAVSGLSMGGGGTVYFALHRPDMFSAACPLSAYVGFDAEGLISRYRDRAKVAGNIAEDKIVSYVQRYSAGKFFESLDEGQIKKIGEVRWWIDCGDDDYLYKESSDLHVLFRQRGVPHQYRVRDGGHTWEYWRSALPYVLGFITEAFH